jgi:hypothetical protein
MNNEIRLIVKDINDENRRDKFTSAVESLAKAMYIPYTVKPKDRESGEKYVYQSQGDLVKKWNYYVAATLDNVYLELTKLLELPAMTAFTKAIPDDDWTGRPASEAIFYRGRIVFNPETGKAIYRDEFEKIIKALEKFLNKRLDPAAKKIVLNSVTLGRVLARKLQNANPEEIRKLKFPEVKLNEKPVDWIADNLSWIDRKMGKLTTEERDRMNAHYRGVREFVDIAEQSMGNKITRMTNDIVYEVRETIIGGVMERKSRKEISQDLFNRMGDLNRDWEKIADTEIVQASNTAFLKETVAESEPGEVIYFRRVEMRDDFVCKFCEKIRGMVVRWSDTPMSTEEINDKHAKVAIWEGKTNIGRKAKDYWVPAGPVHPWCRGSWERWFPPQKG